MIVRLPRPSENGKKLQASQVFRLGYTCTTQKMNYFLTMNVYIQVIVWQYTLPVVLSINNYVYLNIFK